MAASANARRQAAESGAGLADGSFAIRNALELKSAIRLAGRSKEHSEADVKRHIIKRARTLGLSSVLPDGWLIQDDVPDQIVAVLNLEAVGKPVVLQDASPKNNGVMSIKVPFFVGGSLTNAPGYRKRIYFGENLLPKLVQEGNRRIAEGKQPLTVYARHAHATDARDLPVGGIRSLEQEGRTGYAVIEVLDTKPHGENAQKLIGHGFLNAVSLRSKEFALEDGKVNGEAVLLCETLALDGIDFAPDSPAQETYGIQILNEAIEVEKAPVVPEKKKSINRSTKLPDITLEDIRRDAPEILQEIERPFRAEIVTLTQERDALRAERDGLVHEKDASLLAAFIDEIAAKTINPEAFRAKFSELCQEKGVKNVAGAAPFVTPLLLEALEAARSQHTTPIKTREQELRDLFVTKSPGSGNSSQEPPVSVSPPQPALVQENRGSLTVGGLVMPEE